MRHVAGVALALLLAGAGSSLVAVATIAAALSARQAVRAAPIHPFGAAVGLLAFPLGAVCWLLARRRLDDLSARRFEAWSLREL